MANSALKHNADNIEVYIELHRCLATMLRKNRFIRKLSHINLSRAEIHSLIEIDAHGESSIKELQPLLNMDQSSVSRLIKGLVKNNRVASKASNKDKRLKILSLTDEGKEAVAQIDKVAGSIFQTFIDRLSSREEQEVANFYTKVADWYGQPSIPKRKKENVVRMQQRRTSRAIGVLEKNIFSSKLSASQWNIFSEICRSKYPLNPKQLSEAQGIPPNSLSIILEKLESFGFVRRKPATHDSRYIELHATSKGKKFLSQIELQSAQDLQEILHDYSIKRCNRLLSIMQHYLDIDASIVQGGIPSGYSIKRVRSKSSLTDLRSFVVSEIVYAGDAEHIPPHIIVEDSIIYSLLSENEKLVAVCEIIKGKKNWSLNLLATEKGLPPATTFSFLEQIFEKLTTKYAIALLDLSFPPARQLILNAGYNLTGKSLHLNK